MRNYYEFGSRKIAGATLRGCPDEGFHERNHREHGGMLCVLNQLNNKIFFEVVKNAETD
jgi:hypothetical protein